MNKPRSDGSSQRLRRLLRFAQILADLSVLSAALWAALELRFEGDIPPEMAKRVLTSWPLVLVLQYASLVFFGGHRIIWRYFGLREAAVIAKGVGLAASILLLMRLGLVQLPHVRLVERLILPIGLLGIDALLAFIGLVGIRVLRRTQVERAEVAARAPRTVTTVRVLLVGAGRGGHFISRELRARPDLGYVAVGFVDDDVHKVGQILDGLPVVGTTRELESICKELEVERLLITVAGARPDRLRELNGRCSIVGRPVMIVPRLVEILDGGNDQVRIREVTIDDLLGRPPVRLDLVGMERAFKGRVVLVTGAGGSIGSELCRQVLEYEPRALVLVERFENALFEVHRELEERALLGAQLHCRVGDIADRPRMTSIFAEFRPEVVLHAAAHKHVPMMEVNPGEALKNNILGTMVLADTAAHFGVERFVMISTDKAVNPTSVMGCTKRVAELYVKARDEQSATAFATVRFGNVLGSAGSVIPIFKKQIAKGGPVTVTHPDMVRYFMTIPEACQLVLQACALSRGGELYLLDMGEPVKIVDLARDLIRLSGFRPEQDIAIEYSGIRPGEKLFEELTLSGEKASSAVYPGIFAGSQTMVDPETLTAGIERLLEICDTSSAAEIRAKLKELVPEYSGGTRSEETP